MHLNIFFKLSLTPIFNPFSNLECPMAIEGLTHCYNFLCRLGQAHPASASSKAQLCGYCAGQLNSTACSAGYRIIL
uniref:Uncharacterized protein n=1 Tax=Anguilla anguilla TaxID=7936 RepID=A0A0E9XKP5_ANGAN